MHQSSAEAAALIMTLPKTFLHQAFKESPYLYSPHPESTYKVSRSSNTRCCDFHLGVIEKH